MKVITDIIDGDYIYAAIEFNDKSIMHFRYGKRRGWERVRFKDIPEVVGEKLFKPT